MLLQEWKLTALVVPTVLRAAFPVRTLHHFLAPFSSETQDGPGRPNGKRQAGWLVSPRMTALGDMNVLFFLVNLQTADPAYKWSSAAIPSGLTTSFERVKIR